MTDVLDTGRAPTLVLYYGNISNFVLFRSVNAVDLLSLFRLVHSVSGALLSCVEAVSPLIRFFTMIGARLSTVARVMRLFLILRGEQVTKMESERKWNRMTFF